jgi:hypothetical protein
VKKQEKYTLKKEIYKQTTYKYSMTQSKVHSTALFKNSN